MKEDNVVRRIQKLLSLANSSNENEAKAAAQKAQELLLKHNLDMQSMASFNHTHDEHQVGSFKKLNRMTTLILSVLEQCYFVTYYWKRGVVSQGSSFWLESKIHLYGTPTNVSVASYVYNFLMTSYPRLWLQYKMKTNAKACSKNAYFLGISRGIIEQLQSNQKKIEDAYGLVYAGDPELIKKSESCKGIKSRPIRRDQHAIEEGYREGLNLHIAKALENNGENRGLAIEGIK